VCVCGVCVCVWCVCVCGVCVCVCGVCVCVCVCVQADCLFKVLIKQRNDCVLQKIETPPITSITNQIRNPQSALHRTVSKDTRHKRQTTLHNRRSKAASKTLICFANFANDNMS